MQAWFRNLALAAGLAFAATGASAQKAVDVEGIKFEPTIQSGGQTLVLNGAGVRKKFVVKVYAAGLYAAKKSTEAASFFNDTGPRRVSLGMLRDVDADSFISSFIDGLKDNLSEAQFAALRPRIDAMSAILKSIGEAKKGDLINFDYTAEGGTRISLNGQPKGNAIAGGDFYSAVLRIWLGEKPVDAALKKALLGG